MASLTNAHKHTAKYERLKHADEDAEIANSDRSDVSKRAMTQTDAKPKWSKIRLAAVILFIFCAVALVFDEERNAIFYTFKRWSDGQYITAIETTARQNSSELLYQEDNNTLVDNTTYRGQDLRQLLSEDLPEHAWFSGPKCAKYVTKFTRDDVIDVVWLASFPRSGNTWTRYLLEAASGLFTGSGGPDYYNYDREQRQHIPPETYNQILNGSTTQLTQLGYLGERAYWTQGNTIVQKTHSLPQPWTSQEMEPTPNYNWTPFADGEERRAIILIRDPFKSFISLMKYQETQSVLSGDKDFTNIFSGKDWQDFVIYYAQHWYDLNDLWIKRTNESVIIPYENLQKNTVSQLKRMLHFLEVRPDPGRLTCLQEHLEGIVHNKRHDVVPDDRIYPQWLKAEVWSHIHQLNINLKDMELPGLPLNMYSFADEFSRIDG